MSGIKVMLWIIAIVFMTICSTDAEDKAQKWGYDKEDGPLRWGKMFPDECGEQKHRQSPVYINTSAVTFIEDFDQISIVYQKNHEHKMSILNNGETVKVKVEGQVNIVGGSLGEAYRIIQLHFHWGSEDDQGSEHKINGKAYPLEMHMVSYDNGRFATLQEALSGFNSLAVLSTLFEISKEDNPVLDTLIHAVEEVAHKGPNDIIDMDWVDPQSLIPSKTNHFFRYDGSLTTPPCLENVIWTVFSEKQTISEAQLERFRGCFYQNNDGEEVPLVDNFRPPQPLHGREIYASFQPKAAVPAAPVDGTDSSSIVTSSLVLIIGMLAAALRFF